MFALRDADRGIAMAAGSDAAKQASQLVLLESDFSALPDIVMEGRRVVNNITRVAGVLFIKTIYSALLSVFSVLTLSAFPFIPIQITLIDATIEAYPAYEAKTVIYYTTGFVSLFALVKSCLPFNKLRVFLCATSAVGVYTATYLFTGLFKLEALTPNSFLFFAVLVIICIPVGLFLIHFINKIF